MSMKSDKRLNAVNDEWRQIKPVCEGDIDFPEPTLIDGYWQKNEQSAEKALHGVMKMQRKICFVCQL